MKKVISFVRHAQSLANAGWVWTGSHKDIPITELGQSQARQVAEFFSQKPDFIGHTMYLRTLQTALPLIQKYPDVPVEVLPIHEFNYQGAQAYLGTTVEQRRERALEYWEKNDPHHKDGDGAESFMECIDRILFALPEIANKDHQTLVIFTHGQILQLMRLLLDTETKNLPARDIMQTYFIKESREPIRNCEVLQVTIEDGEWGEMKSVFVPKV